LVEVSGSIEERFGIGLWYHWGQIAIRHEAAAWEVRRAAKSSDPELKAVMVSVASAGFAVDSFSASIKAVIGEPEADKDKKQRPRLKALYMRGGAFVDQVSLSKDIDWLIGGRDLLVHNAEGPHLPPRFEEQAVYYKAEAASRAVDIMLRLLGTSIRTPKPKFASWARDPGREELLHALEKERAAAATLQ
jgi:hypothetical protein